MQGVLVLEDGSRFAGQAFGAVETGAVCAEVVFNTGMTGYQEVLTDPSYAGQMVTMTYPLIGNYGVRPEDAEAARPLARAFIVREACADPSHWGSAGDLDAYLRTYGLLGLAGVDTRALVRHLRMHGTLRGVLAAGEGWDDEALAAAARLWQPGNLVAEATTPEAYTCGAADGPHIVLVDYGAKRNIARSLVAQGCRVTVVPAWYGAERILDLDPEGVMLSNGPGDPRAVADAPETLRALLAAGVPVFGVCLGHQLLALALGGQTYKLPFGHRGVNHPVQEVRTGAAFITTQNHGYTVAEGFANDSVEITHVNLNDGTVEGLAHRRLPAWSVQFHPEACPGPEDSAGLFTDFIDRVRPCAQVAAAR